MILKISIIIPCYNRSELLGATLDSILAQTYKNWECIVVDDGSGDYTQELMEFYCEKDSRIKFYKRPETLPKGANACRNYGFEKSVGEYVQWFDSDDLMVPHFLDTKLKALQENDVDYVISKTINFKDPDPTNIVNRNDKYYRFKDFGITSYNYVTQRVNWLTPDLMSKRDVFKNFQFNNKVFSSQEYNFFSQLTCSNTNAFVIDEFLTLRRIHDNSIRNRFNKDPYKNKELEFNWLETWKDVSNLKPGTATEKFFLDRLLKLNSSENSNKKTLRRIFKHLKFQHRKKAAYYMLAYIYIFELTGKGNFLRRKFISQL